MFIKPKQSKSFSRQTAQTLVEFAIVFPVLLLITYGIMEFGRMMFIYTVVTSAAREGARYGATALNYKDCDGIRDTVLKSAPLVPVASINTVITYIHSPTPPTCSPGYSGPNLVMGDRVMVQVTARYEPLIGGFLGISGRDITRTNARTILINVKIDR